MVTSLQIGDDSNHLDDPGVRDLLEVALTDQMAAGLLSRFLRGIGPSPDSCTSG